MSPDAAVLARPGAVDDDCGHLRDSDRALAALVDVAGRRSSCACWLVTVARRHGLAGLRAIAEAADLLFAARAGRSGACRHALVGRGMGRAALRHRSDPQAPGAARCCSIISSGRRAGCGSSSRSWLLRAADGDVVDRRIRSQTFAEGSGEPRGAASSSRTTSPRARSSRCARWRWPIRSSVCCGRKDLAGAGAGRDRARLHRQHGVRDRFADSDGHDADHAGGVCAAAPEVANQPDDLRRVGRMAGLAWTTSPQLQPRPRRPSARDYQLYKTQNMRDIDRTAA